MSGVRDTCAFCKIPAKYICSACKKVAYCSAYHQKEHWKVHKKECALIKIAQNDEMGRFVVVTRDVKAGTRILTESPLIVGPNWCINDDQKIDRIFPCVGCLRPCYLGMWECARCTWPACSPDCEGLQNPNEHGIDCDVLVLGNGPSESDLHSLLSYYRTDALFVLKCLLLQVKNYKQWKNLMDMRSHEEERFQTDLYRKAEHRIVNFLQETFLKKLIRRQTKQKQTFLDQCGPEILHKICGIIETNSMLITTDTDLQLSCLFYKGTMIEHSCVPNSYFKFGLEDGHKMCVFAGRDLQKGEHVKIMFSHIFGDTRTRQRVIRLTTYITCKCERCIDPTELGTHLNTLLCPGVAGKTCTGYQLPKNSERKWKCNTCPAETKETEFLGIISGTNININPYPKTIYKLEGRYKYLSQFLHPNHFMMFSIKYDLIQRYGTEPGYTELTKQQLQKKFQMCEDLMNTLDKLDPYSICLPKCRIDILYHMQMVLKEEAHREIKKETAIKKLKSANGYLETAADIVLNRPERAISLYYNLRTWITENRLRIVFLNRGIKVKI